MIHLLLIISFHLSDDIFFLNKITFKLDFYSFELMLRIQLQVAILCIV